MTKKIVITLVFLLLALFAANAQVSSSGYAENKKSGDTYYQSGEYEKALAYYMAAMQSVAHNYDDELQGRIDDCRRMIEERKCSVSFQSSKASTSIKLDKTKYGFLPKTLTLSPGIYHVELKSRPTKTSYSGDLEVFSGSPIVFNPPMSGKSSKSHRSYGGGDPDGLWFTLHAGLAFQTYQWHYGVTIGHRPTEYFGYYFQGMTSFNRYFYDLQAGVTFGAERIFFKFGAGYRHLDKNYYDWPSTHNFDATLGMVIKGRRGFAITGDFTLTKGGGAIDCSVDVGLGWAFQAY